MDIGVIAYYNSEPVSNTYYPKHSKEFGIKCAMFVMLYLRKPNDMYLRNGENSVMEQKCIHIPDSRDMKNILFAKNKVWT